MLMIQATVCSWWNIIVTSQKQQQHLAFCFTTLPSAVVTFNSSKWCFMTFFTFYRTVVSSSEITSHRMELQQEALSTLFYWKIYMLQIFRLKFLKEIIIKLINYRNGCLREKQKFQTQIKGRTQMWWMNAGWLSSI